MRLLIFSILLLIGLSTIHADDSFEALSRGTLGTAQRWLFDYAEKEYKPVMNKNFHYHDWDIHSLNVGSSIAIRHQLGQKLLTSATEHKMRRAVAPVAGFFHDSGYVKAVPANAHFLMTEHPEKAGMIDTTSDQKFSLNHEEDSACNYAGGLEKLITDCINKDANKCKGWEDYLTPISIYAAVRAIISTKLGFAAKHEELTAALLTGTSCPAIAALKTALETSPVLSKISGTPYKDAVSKAVEAFKGLPKGSKEHSEVIEIAGELKSADFVYLMIPNAVCYSQNLFHEFVMYGGLTKNLPTPPMNEAWPKYIDALKKAKEAKAKTATPEVDEAFVGANKVFWEGQAGFIPFAMSDAAFITGGFKDYEKTLEALKARSAEIAKAFAEFKKGDNAEAFVKKIFANDCTVTSIKIPERLSPSAAVGEPGWVPSYATLVFHGKTTPPRFRSVSSVRARLSKALTPNA